MSTPVGHGPVRFPFSQGDCRGVFGLWQCTDGGGYRGMWNVTLRRINSSVVIGGRGNLLQCGWSGLLLRLPSRPLLGLKEAGLDVVPHLAIVVILRCGTVCRSCRRGC